MESLKLYVLIASYTSLICLKNNPDAALGDVCLSDPSVCDTNIEVCNGTNCVCTETHYDSGGVCMFKKAYGAGCSRSDECGVPAGGIIQCVVVSVVSRCLCTERSYWTGLLCQDVSDLVPALTLSNPTLSTIHASWTTPPAAEYSSVYKLTWATGATTVDSQDNIFFRNFRIEGLTAGTEYTVSIERRIIENNYRRVQTVPEANMVKATKKVYGADCSQSNECGVPSGGNNQCVAVSGGSKCLCTIGKYWSGSLCQDVSSLVPALTLSNPTLSTIDGFWTSSAAAFNDVYKLTWTTGGNAVGSWDNIPGGNFRIESLTAGTEYTVSIERRITETTYLRVQTVSREKTIETAKKTYGADCSQSNECGVPSGGNNQCVAVSGVSRCLCTQGKYWTGSLCQDVSDLVPVLTLSNPTLSTIQASWTASAAAEYNSVYKLTWTTGGNPVGSRENIAGGNFQIEGLTEGTEYTVSIERRITETTYWRVQTVPGANMVKATIPGNPTDFRYVSKTSNSIHLIWTPPIPRPGVTAYNITVYEWQEDVQQYTLFNVIEQLAPTKVVNLKSRKIPGVFNQIGLSWSCPAQKDGRNGVIKKSTVRFSTDTPNADVNPKENTATFSNKDCSWNVTVEVTAEFNYTFEVLISNSIDGQPSVIHEYMEAGPASVSSESTPKEKQITLSSGQTTIPLAVCPSCILDPKNGRVTSSGVIVCTTSCTKTRRKRQLKTEGYFAELPTWKRAKEQNFKTEYRASPDNWLANVKGDIDIVYKVGNDTSCDGKSSDIYCNGPLNEGTTYAIRVFANRNRNHKTVSTSHSWHNCRCHRYHCQWNRACCGLH